MKRPSTPVGGATHIHIHSDITKTVHCETLEKNNTTKIMCNGEHMHALHMYMYIHILYMCTKSCLGGLVIRATELPQWLSG